MDVYLITCDLKPGVRDVAFAQALQRFLDRMQQDGNIHSWRLLRRKLGLGPPHVGEWQVIIEIENLAQLDEAFAGAARRAGDMEGLHFDVNQHACNLTFSLLRDFPDSVRAYGSEKF